MAQHGEHGSLPQRFFLHEYNNLMAVIEKKRRTCTTFGSDFSVSQSYASVSIVSTMVSPAQ
jgi:hypothetical protein